MAHLALACGGKAWLDTNAKYFPNHIGQIENSACLATAHVKDLASDSWHRSRDLKSAYDISDKNEIA